jgi:hypothetical protein
LPRGHGDRAERRVDRAGPDRGDGRVGVEEGHHVEFGTGMRAVEVAQQAGWGEPPADHVDAQRAVAGAYGSDRSFFGLEKIAGVRQERLAVDGEPGAARGTGEQRRTEVLLQSGDALGDGLLSDRQLGGGLLELARIRDGDEGTHGNEIHADRPYWHNASLWLADTAIV